MKILHLFIPVLGLAITSLTSCVTTTVTETLPDGTVRVTKTEGKLDPDATPLIGVVAGTYATIRGEK